MSSSVETKYVLEEQYEWGTLGGDTHEEWEADFSDDYDNMTDAIKYAQTYVKAHGGKVRVVKIEREVVFEKEG